MASCHGCISGYVLVYPKHLPACFQLFQVSPRWGNNPCGEQPLLSSAQQKCCCIPKSSKVSLFPVQSCPRNLPSGRLLHTVPHCLLIPSRSSSQLPVTMTFVRGSVPWVTLWPAPSPRCPGQQGWAFPWGNGMQTCPQQPHPSPHSAQQLKRVSQPSQGGNTSTLVAGCGPNLSSK